MPSLWPLAVIDFSEEIERPFLLYDPAAKLEESR